MFATDDDELDFSAAASSTKLANLFEADHTLMHSGNQSLMYTAPKQPGKKPRSHTKEAANQDSAVQSIHAAVVRAYKYDGTKYVEQGRLGAAIVGNKSTYSYSLLIFKGKQQAVTAAGLSTTFQYTVQNNNYATFYDDHRQNWSINFDSEANSIDFAKQVALAKFNSCGTSNENITVQDLVFCEGSPVKEEDNLCVKYCGTIIENQRFGKVFDGDLAVEHPTVLKLGDHKIIKGWQEGVLGCKVGGHRIILIPASLAFGSKGLEGKVPQNCPVAIEMKVIGVNMPQNDELSSAVLANSPDPSHSSADDGSIKARVASISEQLCHTSKTDKKAKIISRMAKMGQPMLPLRGAVPARLSSESETEDDASGEFEGRVSPKLSSPEPRPSRPAPRPRQRTASPSRTQTVHNIPQQGSPFYQMTTYPQQQPQVTLGHLGQPQMPYTMMPQQAFATQSFSPNSGIDAHVPVLMAEVRTQNVELRMSVAKVTDKLDQVMSKLDHMSVGTSDKRATSLPAMDTEILARSIQKIIQDNEQMKAEITEKNVKLEMQSDKISELLQKNQKFFEQSNNMFFQQSESLQTSTAQSQNRIFQLEQEKTKLTLEMTELKARLSINENQEVQFKEKLKSMRETSDRYEAELGTLQLKVSELEGKEAAAQKQMSEERQQFNHLQNTTSQSNETIISELRAAKDVLEKKLSNMLEKSKEDLATACQENENLKSQHEEQLAVLQNRLHDLETKEVNRQTSQKDESETDQSNALVDEVKQQYLKQIESLKSENKLLQDKLETIEQQLESCNVEVQTLRSQLSDAENLMKDSVKVYEEKISLLETEKGDSEKSASVDVIAEIKKVMNGVYGALRREFSLDETYQGSEVQKVLLATIRDVTLHLLERQDSEASQNSVAVEEKVLDDREEENTGQVKSELASSREEVTNEEVPEQLHVTEATTQESEKKAASEASVTSISDESWKPQPPPLFDELLDEDDDDWLK